jgi:hypothetical protein
MLRLPHIPPTGALHNHTSLLFPNNIRLPHPTFTIYHQSTITMSTADKKWNTTSAAKDAGFRNFPEFLLSYGLRIYNHEDVEQGKEILRGMGYAV